MRTLIIDDSRAMRAILRRSLPPGSEVHDAGHGGEGLQQLAEHGSFDLAMVDWNMPVMNGLEFVRAVRADPAHDEMKILMVTTETEPEQMLAALEAGADEYVMKPFTPDAIADKLGLLGLV